jgi:hypothetical protein
MVEISDIVDRESLEDWLFEQPEAQAVSFQIAHRAAMRVLPLVWAWFEGATREPDLTALPVLRACLTSGVVCYAGTPEVEAVADSAARSAQQSAPAPADFAAGSAAGTAALSAAHSAGYAAVWASIRADGTAWLQDRHLQAVGIWTTENPDATQTWQALKSDLQSRSQGSEATARGAPDIDRSFWIDWYERALNGTENRWDMLTEIALIDDEDWRSDPADVMDQIYSIQEKYATAATPYGEHLDVNPETSKVRSTPLSQLPQTQSADIGDRLQDALAIIPVDDPAANAQYASLAPDIAYLRDGAGKYLSRPTRLYDVIVAVTKRLEHRITVGDCPTPDQDVLIGAFRSEMLAVMDDLRNFDPEVRNVVETRQIGKADAATPQDTETLANAATDLVLASEGDLEEGWRDDAAALRDPMATPEETRQAVFRISSRIIRVIGLCYDTGRKGLSEAADVSKDVGAVVKNSAYVAMAYKVALALFS